MSDPNSAAIVLSATKENKSDMGFDSTVRNSAAIVLSATKENKFDMSFDSTVRIYDENPEELKKLHQQVDELEVKVAKNTDKLDNIEDGADVSPIIEVKVDGNTVQPVKRIINIPLKEIVGIPDEPNAIENGVEYNNEGKVVVKNLNVERLVQNEGDELVLNGGNAV